MELIVFEQEAFFKLVEEVVDRLKSKHPEEVNKRWLNTAEAMQKLGIKSKTSLQKLRDEGKIRFSQPAKKNILYDSFSIDEYLEKNAREPF